MKSKITVVILNWMQSRLTLGAIKNFRKYYPDIPMVVVDNGSKDVDMGLFNTQYNRNDKDRLFDNNTEVLRLATKDFDFKLIELEENLGQGIAVDTAVSSVETEFMLIMDNDARLISGGLVEEYLEKMDEDTFSIGIQYPRNSMYKIYVGLQFGLFRLSPIKKYHLSFGSFKFEFNGKFFELEPGHLVHEAMCGKPFTDRTRNKEWKTIIYPMIDEMGDRILHLKIYDSHKDVQEQIERWDKWIDG